MVLLSEHHLLTEEKASPLPGWPFLRFSGRLRRLETICYRSVLLMTHLMEQFRLPARRTALPNTPDGTAWQTGQMSQNHPFLV